MSKGRCLNMKILFVTSEAYPLLKTGGLADVAGALPAAIRDIGNDVRILIPAYPQVLEKAEKKSKAISLGDPLGIGEVQLIKAHMPKSGVPLLLIDCPILYQRAGNPYTGPDGRDWSDNHLRFAMLSMVAVMLGAPENALGWTPDVMHCNDWQSGLIPAYLHFQEKKRPKTVFTVHNMQYQGLFDNHVLNELKLPEKSYAIEGIEFHNQISFLKAGLYYGDALTTVSPTYAQEIKTLQHGCGLDGLLRFRADHLSGILNGIDGKDWNPETDVHIPHAYGAADLSGKRKSKAALQREQGLPVKAKAPLFCMVSRLTDQKGIDLIFDTVPLLIENGAQVTILGSGDKAWESALTSLAATSPNINVHIGYDENLAHRMIAGADVFMMPSRFEPCGLTQMYALRYGTLPLVRRTGGLADTVVDINVKGKGTGFVFDQPTAQAMVQSAKRALAHYERPSAWKTTKLRAMRQDFSWTSAAQSYKTLYTKL